ncbi:MAG: glycosyltransferase family 4 protein, partial [Pseudomonadota bacterium]
GTTYPGQRCSKGWQLCRFVGDLVFYVSVMIVLLRRLNADDVLVVMTDPPMLPTLAAPLAWIRGARLIVWLQDVFPEVAQRLCSQSFAFLLGPVFTLMRLLRNQALRSASSVVVLGSVMAQYIRNQGVDADRVVAIHNWSHGENVRPILASNTPLRTDWGLRDAFVVGYSGNLGRAHDAETLLGAMEQTQKVVLQGGASPDQAMPLTWVMIGGGWKMRWLEREVHRQGFEHVQFRPYQPRETLSHSLSVLDVHLISLQPQLEGLIVPSKFYGILAAGRPVIFLGQADGEIGRIINEHDIGEVVESADAGALGEAIVRLALRHSWRHDAGVRARHLFEDRFGFETALGKWKRLLFGG